VRTLLLTVFSCFWLRDCTLITANVGDSAIFVATRLSASWQVKRIKLGSEQRELGSNAHPVGFTQQPLKAPAIVIALTDGVFETIGVDAPSKSPKEQSRIIAVCGALL
jgi:hypothetical protein